MTRSARDNPFTPGYGAVPEVFAGRRAAFTEFDEVIVPRLRDGTYEQARLITGNRGVGKTVFLLHLEQDAEEQQDWPVRVSARPGPGVVPDLLRRVAEVLDASHLAHRLSTRSTDALRALAGVRVGPEGISLDLSRPAAGTSDRGAELTRLLVEAGQLARDRGRVLVVLIDEAQNIDGPALADVCHALQEAQSTAEISTAPNGARVRSHLPIAAYLAGLPGLITQLQGAGATFFERSRHLDFGLLADTDVREGLEAFAGNRDVTIDAIALDRMVELIHGYPYFLHLIGSRVWTAGTGPVITEADVTEGYAQCLPDLGSFFAERLRGLGDLQHDWLRAAAALPPEERTTGAVAERLGRRSSQLGSTVRALIDRGLIRMGTGRGKVELGLPGLDRHLLDGEV